MKKTGGGQVIDAAGLNAGNPRGCSVRGSEELHVPGEVIDPVGLPQARAALGLAGQAVAADEGSRAPQSYALRNVTVRGDGGGAEVSGAHHAPGGCSVTLVGGIFLSFEGPGAVRGREGAVWRTPNRSRSSRFEEDAAGWKRVAMSVVFGIVAGERRHLNGFESHPPHARVVKPPTLDLALRRDPRVGGGLFVFLVVLCSANARSKRKSKPAGAPGDSLAQAPVSPYSRQRSSSGGSLVGMVQSSGCVGGVVGGWAGSPVGSCVGGAVGSSVGFCVLGADGDLVGGARAGCGRLAGGRGGSGGLGLVLVAGGG